MRRDEFLKCFMLGVPLASFSSWAQAASSLKMMIPANPGGGWDTTGRALGKALMEAKAYEAVQFENKGGAAGGHGLAQYVNTAKGDPQSLIMMGAVMLGGIISSKSPISITQCTPIARLTSEYNVFVVPANSPFKTMKDVVDALKKDPSAVKIGGGSRGSTEHIASCLVARTIGVDPKKINYVPFSGGGEAVAAVLSGAVDIGGSGYSEFSEQIKTGKLRAIGITSEKRIKGIDVPTLKEQGLRVVAGNWRGVYAAPGISAEQQAQLTQAVIAATKTKAWQDALAQNNWTPGLMTGKEFVDFVDFEFTSLRAIMFMSGLA